MSGHSAQRTHCENCGTELKGPFCHQCGQHDFDANGSFRHAVHEALESFFHWDGKFFKGVFDLLFRPGRLTVEYNAGKRASQIPPLRFYIFVSLLFFLTPSSHSPEGLKDLDIQVDHSSDFTKAVKQARAEHKATPASGKSKSDIALEDKVLDTLEEKSSHAEKIFENFQHYLPRAVLVCLPLFALLSLLVFRKSGYSYLQHLVFSLHLHTFFFLFTLSLGGWLQLTGLLSTRLSGWLNLVGTVYVFVYAYLAIRHVFKGKRKRGTILRGLLLLGSYAFVLALVMLSTIVLAAVKA